MPNPFDAFDNDLPDFGGVRATVRGENGMQPGNIDLRTRPVVRNPDGSVSTVRSMSANFDGREVLLPTVSDDGRIMSDDEAIQLYQRTGRNLGSFATVADADAYAKTLHDGQAQLYGRKPPNPFDAFDADPVGPAPDYSVAFRDDVGIGERVMRGVAAGGEKLSQFANFAALPVGAAIDALRGDHAATDWLGRNIDDTERQRQMLAPNAQTENVGMVDQVIHGAGEMVPDLAMMGLTAGESAGVQPVIQQGVRNAVLRELEAAGANTLRASVIPAAERGQQVAKDVIDRGGSTLEAGGAGAGSAALTALTNMVPASASGALPTRMAQGALSNPVADLAQTQGENALVDDRLGLDREYTAKDALISALTGAPLAGILGERGPQLETKADRAARDVADLDLASLDLLREQQAARTPAPAPEPAPPAPTVAPRQSAPEPVAADVPARAPESDADAFQRELAAAQAALAGGPGKGVDFASSERAPDDELARSLELDDAEYLRRVNPDKEVTGNGATDSLIGELGDREVPERATPIGELGNGITLHADGDYLYAADGDRVVGVLGAKPSGNEFAVDPDYQGRGIGTAMMKELLARQPEALSGGLSPAAEKTRLAARRQLREERAAAQAPVEPVSPPTAGVKAGEPPDQPTNAPPAPVAVSAPAAQPVEPLPVDPGEGTGVDHATQTSLKNEVRNEARQFRGLNELTSGETVANKTVIEEGRAAVEADPNVGRDTVDRIRGGGEVSLKDEGVLLAEDVRLRNLRDAAQERAGDDSLSPEARALAQTRAAEYESQINDLDEAARAIGTEGGRILQLRKRVIANDFSVAALERKARAVKGGPLTADERATIADQAKRIEDLQKQLAEAESRSDAQQVQAVVDAIIARAGGAPKAKTKSRSKLGETILAREAAARARIAANTGVRNVKHQGGAIDIGLIADYIDVGAAHVYRGVTDFADFVRKMTAEFKDFAGIGEANQRKVWEGARASAPTTRNVIEDIDPEEGVTHKDVYDLARQKIEAGMHGEDQVMAAVHKDLKDAGFDLTEREVRRRFSEYGKAQHPSQDAVKKELRELRALVQLQESIDRLDEGQSPLKSGPQRDKPTDAVIAKRAELLDRLRALSAANPQAAETYNRMRERALRKQIDALDRAIITGESKARKAKSDVGSPEVKRLEKLRDTLKTEMAQIGAGDRKNDAEKRALRKRITDVEKRIRGEAPVPRAPESRVDDAETTGLRQQLEALRTKQRDKSLTEARRTAVGEQIAELMQRLAGKDKPAEKAAKPDAAADLVRIRDELQAQLRALENPPKPAAVRHNERMGKLMQNRIAELRDRIANGDFAQRKREPLPLDAEREKIAFELAKVKRDFAQRQFDQQMAQRHPVRKILGYGADTLNTARALMTSLDLSAVLRQGGFIGMAHPKRAARAMVPMLRAAFSAQKEHAINEEILARPNAPLYKRAGLELTDAHSHSLSKMEEAYMSRWVDKIPTVLGGGLVRGSQRAYTTFLNKLRADSFDAMVSALAKNGDKPTDTEIKAIANYVNVATGRGHIGTNNAGATALNTVFFAPRLVASRFNLLFGQPFYTGLSSGKVEGSGRTRKLVAQEYARYLMGVGVVYALAQAYAAATDNDDGQVETDPRSSDFGKIRFGNTYVDPLSGLAQVTSFASKEVSGQKKTTKGDIRDLHKVGLFTAGKEDAKMKFGQDTGLSVLGRFARTKLAPVPGALADQLDFGKNVIGQNEDPAESATGLVTPMSMRDIYGIMVDNGVAEGSALSLLSLLGMGVQNRKPIEDDKGK